jgi:putative oxidoreductase
MKIAAAIAGGLLGLLFIMSSVVVLFNLVTGEPPEEGSAAAHFMAAMAPTGYLTFVKICELLGGLLVAVPKTRNVGLLLLGPIIVNVLAFHIFVTKWVGVFNPMLVLIVVLAAFLLWVERRAFVGLVQR